MHQLIPLNENGELITQHELDEYAKSFFGYGLWGSPLWLIGVEELGARANDAEFQSRYHAWRLYHNNGAGDGLMDLEHFHEAINIKPQWGVSSWRRIRELLRRLHFNVQEINPQWGANFEMAHFPQVLLADAMPFPSPTNENEDWPYQESDIQDIRRCWQNLNIQNRELCLNRYFHQRSEIFSQKIQFHAPHFISPVPLVHGH